MRIEESLIKRKWSKKEIAHYSRILKRGELKKSSFQKCLGHLSFFTALMVFLLGNIFVSLAMIPVLLLTKGWNLFFLIFLFSVSFGVLFELIIINFENKRHHTVIAGLIVPLLVFINFYFIVNLSNLLSLIIFNSEGSHDSLQLSFIYLIFFIIPYLIHKVLKQKALYTFFLHES